MSSQDATNIFGMDSFSSYGFTLQDQVNIISDTIPFQDLEQVCNKFKDLFEGKLGCARDMEAHVTLKQDARPRFLKARPVPFAIKSKVKEELDRLQKQKVIQPINNSSWATPVVIIKKPDGKLRLCGDFKNTINAQSIIDTYPIPKPEELFSKLAGGKFSQKLICQKHIYSSR